MNKLNKIEDLQGVYWGPNLPHQFIGWMKQAAKQSPKVRKEFEQFLKCHQEEFEKENSPGALAKSD